MKNRIMIIEQVAKAVIQEFAADGVKYLELRSTPREVTETGTRSILNVKHLLAAHICFLLTFIFVTKRSH